MSEADGLSVTEIPAVVPLQTAGGVIPRSVSSRLLTHGGITIPHFFAMHVTGAGFAVVAGLMLYGWRALVSIGIVLFTAACAVGVWRRIGARGGQLRHSHVHWLALLLALTLPPHLLTNRYNIAGEQIATWPLLPAAGLLMVPIIWLVGGLGSGRLHPVLIAHLLLACLFGNLLVPHLTLQRSRAFLGDVMEIGKSDHAEPMRGAWISAPAIPERDALRVEAPASEQLTDYTAPFRRPIRSAVSLETLVRDGLPPLQDLIIGGHPGPMGTSCAIAVIIGGLFMLYRGVIDYRIPLLVILSAYAVFLAFPVPLTVHVTNLEVQRHWTWLALRQPGVGAPLAVTFANYELMASPLLFTALFLATNPAVRPMARRARFFYAIVVGVLSATLQLYYSVSLGPYVALLLASILAAGLDRSFRPRTLV